MGNFITSCSHFGFNCLTEENGQIDGVRLSSIEIFGSSKDLAIAALSVVALIPFLLVCHLANDFCS